MSSVTLHEAATLRSAADKSLQVADATQLSSMSSMRRDVTAELWSGHVTVCVASYGI